MKPRVSIHFKRHLNLSQWSHRKQKFKVLKTFQMPQPGMQSPLAPGMQAPQIRTPIMPGPGILPAQLPQFRPGPMPQMRPNSGLSPRPGLSPQPGPPGSASFQPMTSMPSSFQPVTSSTSANGINVRLGGPNINSVSKIQMGSLLYMYPLTTFLRSDVSSFPLDG